MLRQPDFDFMGRRWIFFSVSGALILISLISLGFRGLNLGIEFRGGTSIEIVAAGTSINAEQVRAAFEKAGLPQPQVQTEQVQGGKGGFIVRSTSTDPDAAAKAYEKAAKELKLPSQQPAITTIGPGWGKNVTSSAIWALALSLAAILIYVSVRFDYKMSVSAVVALFHDIIITLGVYSITQIEFTPNTVAALLTILGYSLYDTIVVFHRIKENSRNVVKQSFMQMANESINEVLVRSMNTTFTSVVPPIMLFFFGGATLKDFALALIVGLLSGAWSSIGIAAPLYAMWKEREPKFQALKKKYGTAKA
jgi:SecD/SecF fusion protein